jgi:hypothetical protein
MDEKSFAPIVITSDAATKDFEKIRTQHSDLLVNISEHQEKVKQFKMQKDMEMQQKNEQNNVKEQAQKESEMKQRELDIKQQALTL